MSRLLRISAFIAMTLSAVLGADRHAQAVDDTVRVFVDQATLIKIPDKVGTLVVGNPLIADVAVQAGGTLVLTGKGYGVTNLVALDRLGNVVLEKAILVEGPRDPTVVVFRGVLRETYSCMPTCQKRITLGDAPDYFADTIGQAGIRNSQAQGLQAPR